MFQPRRRRGLPRLMPPGPPSPPPFLANSLLPAISESLGQQQIHVQSQFQSPLYSTIPPEIRIEIFHFALYAYPDPSREPYEKETHYTRPGFVHPQRVAIELLQTCKAIYLETYELPTILNPNLTLWCGRAPPGKAKSIYGDVAAILSYNKEQRGLLRSVHLFTQQFWLEGGKSTFQSLADNLQHLQTLRITLRHGDWWNWESFNELGIHPNATGRTSGIEMRKELEGLNLNAKRNKTKPTLLCNSPNAWGSSFEKFKELKTLEIEFETTVNKKDQLLKVVEFANTWRFPTGDPNRQFVPNPQGKEEYAWDGPAEFYIVPGGAKGVPPPAGKDKDNSGSYCVVILRWNSQEVPVVAKDGASVGLRTLNV